MLQPVCELLHVPFPCHAAHPSPLCSRVSSDAKHKKDGSLAIEITLYLCFWILRNTNQREPCALPAWCLCVQHLETAGENLLSMEQCCWGDAQPRSSLQERIVRHLPAEPWFWCHLCFHTRCLPEVEPE